MQDTKKASKILPDIILLALIAALSFGVLLGARPYSAPSESRYVEIGREMAETGDYVTPRLNYVKYFEKPPLFYWVQAAWTEVAGADFFQARVPTAFFSVLLCLLTYGLGRMLYGRVAGILSSLVIATSLYLFALSRVVLLDVPVSVFLVATLQAFLYAANAPAGKIRTFVIYSMYVAAAGAVLTKGLIGAVLPGAVIFLWFVCTGRWSLLKEMKLVSGSLLFLLIAVPWHIVVWQHNPEHPWFYFVHEHWLRYTTKLHGRYHPWWFFAAVLLAGLLPWLMFTYQATKSGLAGFWQIRKKDGTKLFLALWIGFIFLFFSASDSKLIPYILPIFPPICAMIGGYLSCIWREQPVPGLHKTRFGLGLFFTMLFLIVLAAVPSLLMNFLDADSKVAEALAKGADDVQNLSIAALIGTIALFITYFQAQKKHVIMVLIAIACIIGQLGDLVAANHTKDSMQPFVQSLGPLLTKEDEVVSYDSYYQDLPIYLNRRITVVNWKGELEYGTQHEDTSGWMIDYDEFWKRWLTPGKRMFVVMKDDAYDRIKAQGNPLDKHMYPLLQDGRNILFANVPKESLME
jgi:4-amino-4-deoxy-L-arabinose transferase-like glycosyltransferase